MLEPVHAVTYFSEACAERYRSLGLKGFWMGYFASRSAPLGEASAALAMATFANFSPTIAERALPDAWSRATPAAVLEARLAGSVATLRSAWGGLAEGPAVAEAADLAERAVDACPLEGRALFAALAALDRPSDPVGRLWHAATLLREHRGDGHVAALVVAGLSGLDAHVTAVASGTGSRELVQKARGWTDEDWLASEAGLRRRGWVDAAGSLTERGRAGRQEIEDRTDALAAVPFEVLGRRPTERLHTLVLPLAEAIMASGAVPYPNPVGAPLPS